MEHVKGIVISLDKKTMVVVTEAGDFLKVAIPANRPRPGQTLEIPIESTKSRPFNYLRMMVAVLLILVLSLGMLKPILLPEAVAAVTMDLASSLELYVSKDNRVVKVNAVDSEGQAVLDSLNLTGMDVYQAANLIALKVSELGYLKQEQSTILSVAVVPLHKKFGNTINRGKLQQSLHAELLKRDFEGYLVVDQGELGIQDEASKAGLTVNKYLLWERARSNGAELNVEDLREKSLEELTAGQEDNFERMFPGRWCRVGNKSSAPPMQERKRRGGHGCGPMDTPLKTKGLNEITIER